MEIVSIVSFVNHVSITRISFKTHKSLLKEKIRNSLLLEVIKYGSSDQAYKSEIKSRKSQMRRTIIIPVLQSFALNAHQS